MENVENHHVTTLTPYSAPVIYFMVLLWCIFWSHHNMEKCIVNIQRISICVYRTQ